MKFCPNCGAQLDDTDKFCTRCGSDVRNITSSQINPQPTTRVEHTVPQNKNRGNFLNNKFKYIIIAVAVICAIGGFYKYRTSPAHNPNNPLSSYYLNKVTFVRSNDGELSLTATEQAKLGWGVMCITCKHADPDSPAAKYLMTHFKAVEDMYLYKRTKESATLENYSKHDTKFKRILEDLSDNYFEKTRVKIVPNNTYVKNGDKVKIILPGNSISKKYGIDTTPRVVKVTGLDN